VYARYPRKLASDSRTPRTQRAQGALVGLLALSLSRQLFGVTRCGSLQLIAIVFALTMLPFVARYFERDPLVVLLVAVVHCAFSICGFVGAWTGNLARKNEARHRLTDLPMKERPSISCANRSASHQTQQLSSRSPCGPLRGDKVLREIAGRRRHTGSASCRYCGFLFEYLSGLYDLRIVAQLRATVRALAQTFSLVLVAYLAIFFSAPTEFARAASSSITASPRSD